VDEHPETLVGIAAQKWLQGRRLGCRGARQESCCEDSCHQRLDCVHAMLFLDVRCSVGCCPRATWLPVTLPSMVTAYSCFGMMELARWIWRRDGFRGACILTSDSVNLSAGGVAGPGAGLSNMRSGPGSARCSESGPPRHSRRNCSWRDSGSLSWYRLGWSITRSARSARLRRVAGHPLFLGQTTTFNEFTHQVGRAIEVHLVGGSAIEGTMGHHLVVLLYIEGDKPFYRRGGVKRVQVRPRMLQAAPSGLD